MIDFTEAVDDPITGLKCVYKNTTVQALEQVVIMLDVPDYNFKDCNFRVLRSIFLGVSIKQKLLKIEKYLGKWPFFS